VFIFAFIKETNQTMSKSTKKYNKFNSLVINTLSEKHGFTKQFIRQCLRKDRNSLTSDTIRKEYKQLVKKVENVLNH